MYATSQTTPANREENDPFEWVGDREQISCRTPARIRSDGERR